MKRIKAITYKGGGRLPSPNTNRPSTNAIKVQDPADAPGLINGIQAGSSYEWNVARALWTLKWEFEYQLPLHGGRRRRGGIVLDFLVSTRPFRTPLSVKGDYWHRNADIDKVEETIIKRILGDHVNPVLSMWRADAETYELALSFLSAKIGRGG